MTWQPLLDGDDARTALEIVRAIADANLDAAPAMDRAVFWAYVAGHFDDERYDRKYGEAVDALIGELRGGVEGPGLHGGLAGIGWTLAHVLEGEASDALLAIDTALLQLLDAEEWTGPYDLVEGLVGFGVYFLERVDRSPVAGDGLVRVVEHIAKLAIATGQGVTWFTPASVLPATEAARFPDGFNDCGMAHGAPGVIALINRVCEHDAPLNVQALRDAAIEWVIAQRFAGKAGFPSKLVGGKVEGRNRNAWCYGDAGIAAALFRARPEQALDVAHFSAERSVEQSGVVDAALCHGAAGLMHLFARLWNASRAPELATAGRAWFAEVLKLRGNGGVAGFAAMKHAEDGAVEQRADASLLDGAIGIGLALLAAATPAEPSWDRLLLCDLPPTA